MKKVKEEDIELYAFEFLRKVYSNQIEYSDEIIKKDGSNWKVLIKDVKTGKTRYLKDTKEKRNIVLIIDPESMKVIQFTVKKDL